ncbi:MAG: cbb3-type cytochrome c oxidase subunit II [Actinomycetia bacterium]|nr:cbb3-type cytochrome c oxidase subunit II [Actinomycetes bacterium]
MTAETSPNDVQSAEVEETSTRTARTHLVVAAILLVTGLAGSSLALFQIALPDLASTYAFTSYGRIAPASRLLLTYGWAVIGLLGVSYFALSKITNNPLERSALALASLVALVIASAGGAAGILFGLNSGITGLEAPIWSRALLAIGALLATMSITATARSNRDRLGTAGWYLTAAPILLTLTALAAILPAPAGTSGAVVGAFGSAGLTLFMITAAVGLLYFVFGHISGSDPTEAGPLAALGFWSLILVWSFMSATRLIFSPAPNWFESIGIAFAIGAIVPTLVIVTDLGLLLKGRIASVGDKASLRYATVGGLAFVATTAVNLLLTWPATSSIVQFSPWVRALQLLVVLGGVSFAIFAGHRVLSGGSSSGSSFHFAWSLTGLTGAVAALLMGGVAVGFSWAAGPTSQNFANWGPAWKVTADTVYPFLWVTAASIAVFTVAQIIFLVRVGSRNDEDLAVPDGHAAYDLEFSGKQRYATWKRLTRGVVAVWLFAAMFTAILPMVDSTDAESTLLADTERTYADGSAASIGRDLYVSEGCAECHTQQVRPVASDVGLGAVSLAGDYAHENPVLLGAYRLGPDLMHLASREGFNVDAIGPHLINPRAARSWSTMPSYSYLSDSDIDALVTYIETLR